MPTYPVINQKTKEKKELSMTMKEYDEWRNDPENSDWDKDWQAGVAGLGEVGEWRDKLITRNPSWNDVLGQASKVAGSRVTKINK
tara:strand:- start:2595 stop:2849 length:255 start_codon:yes stop_codon:yes gene_type:complete